MAMIPSFFGNQHDSILDPFSFDVWNPFKDFAFPSLSSRFPRETSAIVNTRMDWKETPEAHVFKVDLPGLTKEEAHVFKVDLPGLTKEDVKLEIEDNRVLQITADRNVEREDKNETWHRVERSRGKFLRRFRLPENGKIDQVRASIEDGVLTVTVQD